ncbi:baseplate assembly protein [Aeromonas salmonicida]|uniref:baseplate assembly protein n=1 Tax=Aeromonas salmonicida TaxID=645 RepID=UPI001C62F5DE|nr:baseplate J/gp47 family protein [Aeromonas salmonicida]QYH27436.1 baseplate assembly protein [Aeromonas salmonicida subsp. masoucida]QYH31725.1 baseplate assembly protein [Aeromonas salmonicida subsp. masoucida]
MSTIDLSLLPPPSIVESLDFEVILTERKAALIAIFPADQRDAIAATLALESEPLTKFLQENAYRELLLRARVNKASVSNMLAWSTDADLDNLVANWNVARLTVQQGDPSAIPPVQTIMESDEALRERSLLAWDALSVAGPREAYRYHARTADGTVMDAEPTSPNPGVVDVYILAATGDGTPSAELLTKVADYLTNEDRVPLTDNVHVKAAQILPYTLTISLFIPAAGPSAAAITAEAERRLTEVINPRRRIGVEVPRSLLEAALHVPGVRKVELVGWVDITPEAHQAAWCSGYTIEQVIQ